MADNTSHLYPAFRLAGRLPSIREQRRLQASILNRLLEDGLPPGRFLSVGVAWGDELRDLLGISEMRRLPGADAIDVADGAREATDNLAQDMGLTGWLSFCQLDLASLAEHPNYGHWSIIQCGFVLEDIEYEAKQGVCDLLFHGLVDGGVVIVSEMYMDNRKREGACDAARVAEVLRLYDIFLDEMAECHRNGVLSSQEYGDLCGTDSTCGVLAARRGAMDGVRDFFETRDQTGVHLSLSGFAHVQFHQNAGNPYLGVLVAVKGRCRRAAGQQPVKAVPSGEGQ